MVKKKKNSHTQHYIRQKKTKTMGFIIDVNNGLLMKIDNMANIQLNTVHGK